MIQTSITYHFSLYSATTVVDMSQSRAKYQNSWMD